MSRPAQHPPILLTQLEVASLERRRRLTTFQPADKGELQTAVNTWCSDEAGATTTYGAIASWDTSLVTDMSGLFSVKLQCNPPIGDWDTGAVTTMR